jgi:hypothetical protein
MAGLLDFLRDSESQKAMRQGLLDAANRGMLAGTLGAPVDLATQAANLGIAGAGYAGHKLGLFAQPPELIDSRNVPGSSEWIGQKMQNAGAVSPIRNAIAEAGMGLLSPVAMKGANKLGGLLFSAEQGAAANLAKPSTMPMSGQRGVLRMANDPIDKIEQKYPGAQEFVKQVERLSEQHGKIYARWSSSEAHDLAPGSISRDYANGGQHYGLSAVPIDSTTHPVDIAKRLAEYNFLRMNDKSVYPRIYTGKSVGVDSDGYDSITGVTKALDVPASFVGHIDTGFVKAYELADSIREARDKVSKTTGAAQKIWQESLDKDVAKLNSILSK